MSESPSVAVQEILARWHGFQECPLDDIRVEEFGYSVRLTFDHVWQSKDVLRDDLDVPSLVSLRCVGVRRLEYVADAPARTVADRAQLAPGGTEVSLVVAIPSDDPVAIRLGWDWDGRALEIHCVAVEEVPPEAPGAP
ncbi:hypothetical protein ACFP63_16000 [Oerskovia jenensis]|uniref:Uncharacterized protein n=1 Tax=Oerskovia jenensis TaxID=162169 RepID=A0ABS2LDX6_9CELL|nr:hypothetical protein [Oerskovia jenensis]MBM7478629.1 hypothetical protein [Oerskovia jenensis]